MKVALVHDYLKEFGGAERVLKVLAQIYPNAPIYTSFYVKDSAAEKEFRGSKIHQSFLAPILKIWRLYSPLRFLIPVIWGSMDLTDYDLVISSSSSYIARGFKTRKDAQVVCYCHTPPRWLYGYETSVGFTKYLPVRIYSLIVGHFLRMYDYVTAQKIDHWIVNSENVKQRVRKFYRKESIVIYPPVDTEEIQKTSSKYKKENFFLIASRLVGAKGIEHAAMAAKEGNFKLKIVGEAHGFSSIFKELEKTSGGNVELLGRVPDSKLWELYGKARGFLALAKDEDFGMTPVEAQAAGTPVIAYNGGGFKESVIDGKTGILINKTDIKTINNSVEKLIKKSWDKTTLYENAERFSKKRFIKEVTSYISEIKEK